MKKGLATIAARPFAFIVNGPCQWLPVVPLDIEPLDIEPLDMEPLDMEPLDIAPLAFFFGVAVFLSVMAPLDIEPVDAPLDMPLADEPFDMEPFDMEPVLLPCAKADPATATLTTAAAANTASLDISYSR